MKKPTVDRSKTGYSKLTKFVNLKENNLFQQPQQFYIHNLSPFYDLLIGRNI